MSEKFTFRYAKRDDISLILQFIKDLAAYEKMINEVVADEKTLEEWIFDKQKAEVIFAVVDDFLCNVARRFHQWCKTIFQPKVFRLRVPLDPCQPNRLISQTRKISAQIINNLRSYSTTLYRNIRHKKTDIYNQLFGITIV